MKRIFIDGKAGTTGLRIYDRLASRSDVELIVLSEEERKDPVARKRALNAADVAFLCLPDAASREAVAMTENPQTVLIDTSTAHRTNNDWTYGFPELSADGRQKVASARRVAVPGCHASGFIALVKPLIEAGFISNETALTCFSVTGYSGGGKKMIEAYENEPDVLLSAPRQYGLSQQHKHLPEMQAITGLAVTPVFCPVVSDFYSGMQVTVPLFAKDLKAGVTVEEIKNLYRARYTGPVVRYADAADEEGFLSAAGLSGKDSMEIAVFGNEERILLTARYDNLGKGASGAAIQCLNLLLGADETEGL